MRRAILVGLLNTLKLAVRAARWRPLLGVTLGLDARRRQSAARAARRRLRRDRPQHAARAAAVLLDRADPHAAAGAAGVRAAAVRLSLGARRLSAVDHRRGRGDLAGRRRRCSLLALVVHASPQAARAAAVDARMAVRPAGGDHRAGRLDLGRHGVRARSTCPARRASTSSAASASRPSSPRCSSDSAVYYAANIAEIVRSGLQSVTQGTMGGGARARAAPHAASCSSSSCRRRCG